MSRTAHPFPNSARRRKADDDTVDAVSVAALPRLIESFLLTGDIDGHASRTIETRRGRLSRLIWWAREVGMNGQAVQSVGTDEIRAYLHYLRHGHEKSETGSRWNSDATNTRAAATSGTVKSYHATLRTFFNWLVEEGEIDVSPMLRVSTPLDRPDQVQPFTDDEVAAIVAETRKTPYPLRDMAIVLLLLDTGIRASELCSLTVNDVNRDERLIRIRQGKGDKARTVPFSLKTRRAILQHLSERATSGEEALFLTQRGTQAGNGITRSGLYQLIARLCEAAGISRERCGPHTFRHTFAVNFLRGKNPNIMALKAMLGHESLSMVNRYVALAQADLTNQHAQNSPVERLFGEGRKHR